MADGGNCFISFFTLQDTLIPVKPWEKSAVNWLFASFVVTDALWFCCHSLVFHTQLLNFTHKEKVSNLYLFRVSLGILTGIHKKKFLLPTNPFTHTHRHTCIHTPGFATSISHFPEKHPPLCSLFFFSIPCPVEPSEGG